MRISILLPLFFILIFASCKNYYTASNFDEITQDHQTIAVLPLKMEFTGVQPRNFTPEVIEAIEESESLLFQESFFYKILESTRRGKRQLTVNVQHYAKTQKILEDNGISVRDSWFEDPAELAEILGVDAVVKGRIQKTRYFSDIESYGIEVGQEILNVLTDGNIFSGVNPPNKNVQASYSLIEKKDGAVLWSIDFNQQADWTVSAEQIVNSINHRSARRFPYRGR